MQPCAHGCLSHHTLTFAISNLSDGLTSPWYDVFDDDGDADDGVLNHNLSHRMLGASVLLFNQSRLRLTPMFM